MENFNLNDKHKKDITRMIFKFYNIFEPAAKDSCELSLINKDQINIKRVEFLESFIKSYEIIRTDEKLIKYFVLGNITKLNKNLNSENILPFLNCIEYMPNVEEEYFILLRNIAVILENSRKEKDLVLLNTIKSVIEKKENERQDKIIEEAEKELKKSKLTEKKEENSEIPSISSLITKLDSIPESKNFKIGDTSIGDMLSNILGNSTHEDIDSSIKEEVSNNSQLKSLITTLNSTIEGNNEGKGLDLVGLMSSLIPDSSNGENSLTETIINDILAVFDKENDDEKLMKIFRSKVYKYVKMFNDKTVNFMDVLSCLLNIIKDDEKTKILESVDLTRVDIAELINIAFDIIPNGETFKMFLNLGDIAGITNMSDLIKNLLNSNKDIIPETNAKDIVLDKEQNNELEDYINNLYNN